MIDVGWPLVEARRVLRPGGHLRFVEYGLSPDPKVGVWQHRLTRPWRRCAGGCHLNRKVDDLIRAAGFDQAELSTDYALGPRAMTYMYEGVATALADESFGINPTQIGTMTSRKLPIATCRSDRCPIGS
jgi:hypothetical protein